MTPLFTVIIPVYNTEKYLRKCLDSVIAAAGRLAEVESRSRTIFSTPSSASAPASDATANENVGSGTRSPSAFRDGGSIAREGARTAGQIKQSNNLKSNNSLVEIICVDDGSTDGSGKILDEYAERLAEGQRSKVKGQTAEFSSSSTQTTQTIQTTQTTSQSEQSNNRTILFKVLHQPNAGVSAARNAALDMATGEWVMMLDPDDSWSADLLVELVKRIKSCPDCDCVGFGMVKINERGEEIGEFAETGCPSKTVLGDEILYDARGPLSKFLWSSCDKCFRRSEIERIGLRYRVGQKYEEDSLFSQTFFTYARKCVLAPELEGYRYLMHDGSAIHKTFSGLLPDPFGPSLILLSHWRKVRSPGLRRYLALMLAQSPYLGSRNRLYEPCVRPKAIEFLLSDHDFNHEIISFMLWHGTPKSKIFAAVYLLLPRCLRRQLLKSI